jgi:hypothetical protein
MLAPLAVAAATLGLSSSIEIKDATSSITYAPVGEFVKGMLTVTFRFAL